MRAVKLKREGSGARGVHRIFRRQVAKAVALLGGEKLSDADVHAARKELKKARATLRLLRGALSDASYRQENASLRDAARPLSTARDARVLLDTLDGLIDPSESAARDLRMNELRDVLRRERARSRRAISASAIGQPRTKLRQSYARSARWRTGDPDWGPIGPGLRRTYRRGRRSFDTARSSRKTEDLHEWRKQVKYLWHELQLLEPMQPELIGALADRAHKLANQLGEDHDLAVLRSRVVEHGSAQAEAPGVAALVALIDRKRARLQRKAFALGRRIYGVRSRRFEQRFRKLWSDWRGQGRRSLTATKVFADGRN